MQIVRINFYSALKKGEKLKKKLKSRTKEKKKEKRKERRHLKVCLEGTKNKNSIPF